MVPEEESKPPTEQSVGNPPSDAIRRRGRSRRGGRGRGRGRRPEGPRLPKEPLQQEDKRADETPAPAHAALADEADVEPAAEVSEPVRTYAEPPPEPIPA